MSGTNKKDRKLKDKKDAILQKLRVTKWDKAAALAELEKNGELRLIFSPKDHIGNLTGWYDMGSVEPTFYIPFLREDDFMHLSLNPHVEVFNLNGEKVYEGQINDQDEKNLDLLDKLAVKTFFRVKETMKKLAKKQEK